MLDIPQQIPLKYGQDKRFSYTLYDLHFMTACMPLSTVVDVLNISKSDRSQT